MALPFSPTSVFSAGIVKLPVPTELFLRNEGGVVFLSTEGPADVELSDEGASLQLTEGSPTSKFRFITDGLGPVQVFQVVP